MPSDNFFLFHTRNISSHVPRFIFHLWLFVHIIRHFFSTEAHFYRLISIPVVLGQHYHGRVFNARRMFRFGILCVRSMVRIRRLKLTPESLSISVARRDPYRMKAVRKVRVVPFASPPPPKKKLIAQQRVKNWKMIATPLKILPLPRIKLFQSKLDTMTKAS